MGMPFALFSLGGNDILAERIAERLGKPLGKIKLKAFSDGEQYVQFLENIRERNVFLIQPTNPPAENWVRLFLALDAAHGASAKKVTAIIPYYGYARQDRKAHPREPISSRTFAELLDTLGAHHILTMDLHTDTIGGFFRQTNVDYLYARPIFVTHFKKIFADAIAKDEFVVVSPDAGGVARAQSYAKRLMERADLAIIHKEREIPNQVARMKLVGDVKGKIALVVDDMLDTCGTLSRAAELLVENGAREIYAAATHGVLSGEASERLDGSPITRAFITDTISPARELSKKIEVLSVSGLFADAISLIETGGSLSALFESE